MSNLEHPLNVYSDPVAQLGEACSVRLWNIDEVFPPYFLMISTFSAMERTIDFIVSNNLNFYCDLSHASYKLCMKFI